MTADSPSSSGEAPGTVAPQTETSARRGLNPPSDIGLPPEPLHLVVKWSPSFGANTIEEHRSIADAAGSVWWGLIGSSNRPKLSPKRLQTISDQLERGQSTRVFISGPTTWQTELEDITVSRAKVDEELVPRYYSDEWSLGLWVKLKNFEAIDRQWLTEHLVLASAPGKPLSKGALSNQTNPLIVQDQQRASGRAARVGGDEPTTMGGASHPSTAVTSDIATTHDTLQYELYADAIARFISDHRTTAPLTIGIKAPWGAGKSSLMKMVRRKLDPYSDHSPIEDDTTPLSNRDILGQTKLPPERAASRFAIEPLNIHAQRTTVWFNAWKYQSSEQFWAGLGHAIISQVEQRMTVAERERFWASLNIRRVNVREVRRRIYTAFFERIAGYAVALPFLVITLTFTAVWEPIAAAGGAVGAGVAAAVDVARRWRRFTKEDAATSNPELVRDPGYEGRLGFLHLVHEDLERVLDLVASPERPLVVFVDDLDRCSYTTVSQVIEALNAFLAGDFEHCMFVIAMEPDLVAAQIHVAYHSLFDHLSRRDAGRADELGWRFLEKMVQLPLALPPPGEAQLKEFVGSLVGAGGEGTVELSEDDQQVLQAREIIEEARGDDPSLDGVERALASASARHGREDEAEGISKLALRQAARLVYADEFDDRAQEVRSLVERHAADLDRNPREIKRFLNVFRFYAYVAFWRRTAGIEAPDLEGAAKLATLAVRCPHLLSSLGADGLLARLEKAETDNVQWARAVADAPEKVRNELERTETLRTIIGRRPQLGEHAIGFL